MSYALKVRYPTEFFRLIGLKMFGNSQFCSHCFYKYLILSNPERRSASTYTSLLKIMLKKRRLRDAKRKPEDIKQTSSLNSFSEYMKVTNDRSTKTKIKICQIKASDVEAFAENPSMTFETYKSKNYKYGTEFNNVNRRSQSPGILEPQKNFNHVNSKQRCSDQSNSYNVKLKPDFNPVLKMFETYIDVAITIGKTKEALHSLEKSRKSQIWKKNFKSSSIVEIYNQMLFAFSANWKILCKIIKWMEEDGVKLNYQSYAALLNSLEIVKSKNVITLSEWKEKVYLILAIVRKLEHSLHGLFTQTILQHNQSENVLKAIRAISPQYEIPPLIVNLNSSCELLKNLFVNQNKTNSRLKDCVTPKDMTQFIKEQLLLEQKFSFPVKGVKLKLDNISSEHTKKDLEELRKRWESDIRNAFVQNLRSENLSPVKLNSGHLSMYLKCLGIEEFTFMLMETVEQLVTYSGTYSPSLQDLRRKLGFLVYNRFLMKKKIKTGVIQNIEKLFQKYSDWCLHPTGPANNSRQMWQMLLQEYLYTYPIEMKEFPWPDQVKLNIGKFLYDIILQSVTIPLKNGIEEKSIPVFYTVMRKHKDVWKESIKCHPIVHKLFQKAGFENINVLAVEAPMLCPPKPWKSVEDGGYLISKTQFIRVFENNGKKVDLESIPNQQLYSPFDALNSLQTTPWKINKPVLDVILKIFEKGGCNKLGVPIYPNVESTPIHITTEMDVEQRTKEYKKKRKEIINRHNQYALWCEAFYRLSLANHYRDKIFWLPQNFDFRGRVYPIPPNLSQIGCDLFRSVLLFAEGKPLGPKGFDWLKIHTINLTGTHKRASIEERLNYANLIIPEILDSAEKPLNGNMWWSKSDDPWQTLASCMEVKKALDSGNPETYVSHFPIHQDGSCNGLQHYAALGRDMIGAKSVNLVPSNVPQDVYSVITQIIEKMRDEDAKRGIAIAKILEGYVLRKVVKQTIMTTVYGVTRYGAREQITKQLEDIESFPKKHIPLAADYLAVKVFESIQQMFTSAKSIQDWFIKCAAMICAKNDCVQWISPLGLPVFQPYFKKPKRNSTIAENLIEKPNLRKQKNAFPPNFVHSLDSSHMMLTALYCEQQGITFASIHDCFWTHACFVDQMNVVCREQFIALHSQSILESLSQFFIKSYIKNDNKMDSKILEVFQSIPKTGDFDVNSVKNSVYFFS